MALLSCADKSHVWPFDRNRGRIAGLFPSPQADQVNGIQATVFVPSDLHRLLVRQGLKICIWAGDPRCEIIGGGGYSPPGRRTRCVGCIRLMQPGWLPAPLGELDGFRAWFDEIKARWAVCVTVQVGYKLCMRRIAPELRFDFVLAGTLAIQS